MLQDAPVHGLQGSSDDVSAVRTSVIHMDQVLVYVVPNFWASEAQGAAHTDDEGVEDMFVDGLIVEHFPVD